MAKYKMSDREKNILGVCVALAVIFIFYQFVFMPLRTKAEMLENKMQVLENKLNKSKTKVLKAKRLKEGAESLIAPYRQKGAPEAVMSAILSSIEESSKIAEVVLADVKPQKVRKEEFANYFAVNLSVEGELSEVVKFLHQLQNPPQNFQIDEINMHIRSSRSKAIKTRLKISRILVP